GLKEAREELDILKLSDRERRAYDSYLENLRYKASMYESHYTVGQMNGEKTGERKGILKTAKSLKENNAPIDLIINSTGLTKEEIEAL
ncbi:MAG: hypothetical protein GY765_32050, partial [bacterium]|nr:hypothetical protein [bacterium]